MKFIDKKISDTYFQLYIILNVKEKKSLITNIKNEILINQKEDLKDSLDKMLANLQQCSDIVGSLQAQAEQIAAAAQGNMTQMR